MPEDHCDIPLEFHKVLKESGAASVQVLEIEKQWVRNVRNGAERRKVNFSRWRSTRWPFQRVKDQCRDQEGFFLEKLWPHPSLLDPLVTERRTSESLFFGNHQKKRLDVLLFTANIDSGSIRMALVEDTNEDGTGESLVCPRRFFKLTCQTVTLPRYEYQ